MEPDKEIVIKEFKCWITKAARDNRCYDEDIAYTIHDYLSEAISNGKY